MYRRRICTKLTADPSLRRRHDPQLSSATIRPKLDPIAAQQYATTVQSFPRRFSSEGSFPQSFLPLSEASRYDNQTVQVYYRSLSLSFWSYPPSTLHT